MHSRIVEEEPMLRCTEIFVVASLEVEATETKRMRVGRGLTPNALSLSYLGPNKIYYSKLNL